MKSASIALLHYSCPPVVGGVEEIVRQQASLFQRYYHPVKIFAGKGAQFIDNCAVEIYPFLWSRNPRVVKIHNELSEKKSDFFSLIEEISDYLEKALSSFDVLIAHNVLSVHYNLPLTYALHQLADTKKIKLISWNHDSPFFYKKYPHYLNDKHWQILKKYNPNIHYVTISRTRLKQFRRLYGPKREIHVIPNGIDPIRFFQFDPVTVRVIQENHLFESEFLMVQPCRLHPRKNIEISIQVIRALQDKGLPARLLLTGSYDPHEKRTLRYYRKLKKLAVDLEVEKDIFIMAEYFFKSGEKLELDPITIRDLYLISDVLFLPSKQEGFGLPLLEAGMIKLPIICSEIPPFREIAKEHVCYISLQESPAEIADKIIEFTCKLYTCRMHRNVIRNYVWDNIYHQALVPYLKKVVETEKKNKIC